MPSWPMGSESTILSISGKYAFPIIGKHMLEVIFNTKCMAVKRFVELDHALQLLLELAAEMEKLHAGAKVCVYFTIEYCAIKCPGTWSLQYMELADWRNLRQREAFLIRESENTNDMEVVVGNGKKSCMSPIISITIELLLRKPAQEQRTRVRGRIGVNRRCVPAALLLSQFCLDATTENNNAILNSCIFNLVSERDNSRTFLLPPTCFFAFSVTLCLKYAWNHTATLPPSN